MGSQETGYVASCGPRTEKCTNESAANAHFGILGGMRVLLFGLRPRRAIHAITPELSATLTLPDWVRVVRHTTRIALSSGHAPHLHLPFTVLFPECDDAII